MFPFFKVQSGRYEYIHNVISKKLGNTRDVVVYLPPSYDENLIKSRYDILIMQDGQNIFNDSTAFGGVSWKASETLDSLIVNGKMREIIVVAIDNAGLDRTDEYTYSKDPQYGGGNANAYLDFVESVIFELINDMYPRARRLPSGKAVTEGMLQSAHGGEGSTVSILGSSLGGLLSCYALWTRPSIYSQAACMSPSFWWNNQDFNDRILESQRAKNDAIMYLDCGDKDGDTDIHNDTVIVANHLISMGWLLNRNLYYYLQHGGEHNEKYWGERLHIPLEALFPVTPLNK